MTLLDLVQDFFENGKYTEEGEACLNAFKTNPENIPECQRQLQTPGLSTKVSFFFASALQSITATASSTVWSFKDSMNIVAWILEYLETNPQVSDSVITQLAACVAEVLISNICNPEVYEALAMVEQVCRSDPSRWRVSFLIQGALVSEMTHRLRNGIAKPTDADVEEFTRVLLQVFKNGMDVVMRFQGSQDAGLIDVCCSALEMCHTCLSFSLKPEDDSNLDWRFRRTAVPREFKELVFRTETISSLFEFYRTSRKPAPLLCMRDIGFMPMESQSQNIRNVIVALFVSLGEVFRDGVGLDDACNLNLLALIMGMIGQKLRMDHFQQIAEFADVLNVMFTFTEMTLEAAKTGTQDKWEMVSNVMTFWSSIVAEAGRCASPISNHIGEQAVVLFQKYLEFLLFLASRDMDASKELLGNGKPSSLIGFLKDLVGQNTAAVVPPLLNIFDKQMQDVEAALSSGDEWHAMLCQSQLALIVYVMIDILKKKMMGDRDTESLRFHAHVLARLVTLCSKSEEWLGAGQNAILEPSIIFFISQFSLTLFGGSPCAAQGHLYSQLSTISGFREIASKQALTNLLFNRLMAPLRCPMNFETIQMAVATISKVPPPSPEMMGGVIGNLNPDVFPFMREIENPDWSKLRGEFILSITQIVLKMRCELLAMLLESFAGAFSRLSEPAIVAGLAVDLAGVFMAIKKSDSYTIAFNWLFPARAMSLVQIMPGIVENLELSQSMLRLCRSIVMSSPVGRIVFPSYSPNGIILFKHAAEIMMPYLNRTCEIPVQSDLYIEKYRGFKKCCQILDSLLTSDVVLFDAFEIYSDSVFDDLLRMFSRVMHVIDMDSLFEHPKVVAALLSMLKALAANQLGKAIACDPTFFNMIVELAVRGTDCPSKDLFPTSLLILAEVGRFIVDNMGTPGVDEILKGDVINHIIKCLWNLVFSKSREVAKIAEALIPFLTLDRSSIDAIKGLFFSAAPQQGGAIEQLFVEFNGKLAEAIGRGNSSSFPSSLRILSDRAKSIGVQVNFT